MEAPTVARQRTLSRSTWRTACTMMINPGSALKTQLSDVPWPSALAVSGISFALFFLQTGLDRARVGHADYAAVIGYTVAGAFYGTLGLAILASVAWIFTRPFRDSHSLSWTLRAFGLSYSSALVFGLFGLGANIALHWNTSVAFGVTGVLWALGPLLATSQELARGKLIVGIGLTIICGGILLWGWALLGAS